MHASGALCLCNRESRLFVQVACLWKQEPLAIDLKRKNIHIYFTGRREDRLRVGPSGIHLSYRG